MANKQLILYLIKDKDKFPPALIEMAAEPLTTPVSVAMTNSFKYNIFPCNAKVACVKSL